MEYFQVGIQRIKNAQCTGVRFSWADGDGAGGGENKEKSVGVRKSRKLVKVENTSLTSH